MTHHHHGGAPHPSPAIAPSLLRLSAPRRLAVAGVCIALIWARILVGDAAEQTMAELRFHNLTLGYERHPAVHHLDGAVRTGALLAVVGPNGAGKSTLFKGIVGTLKPLAGAIERNGFDARDIAYLPQVPEIDRSFPISVYDMVAMGLWRSKGAVRRHRRQGSRRHRSGHRRRRPDRIRAARHRHAVGRTDAAHAVRAPAGPGRARDRARRAVHRDRCQNLGRSAGPGAALARRKAHRARGAARHRSGQG